MLQRRKFVLAGSALASSLSTVKRARAKARTVRIGVMTDLSGPYQDVTGKMSVASVRQAIADMQHLGISAEVVVGDFQSKPDLAVSMSREWFDRDGVDVIVDVPSSSAALAMSTFTRERNKVLLVTAAGSTMLTGDQCTPNTIHWSFSTYMNARSVGSRLIERGGTSWYIIAPNMAFGHQLTKDLQDVVLSAGGKVLGSTFYPFPATTDFSSALLTAQASGAKVVALANSGADTVNSVKQAREFGIQSGSTIAVLGTYITDIHSLGLEAAAGLVATELFYWDLNDRTRQFTKRLLTTQNAQLYPNSNNASGYSAVVHFLKATAALGGDGPTDGAAVVATMKQMAVDDDALGAGSIRSDGRHLAPSYLFQVKSPSESAGPWDCFKLLATTPAETAFQPPDKACPLNQQRGG